MRHAGFGCPRAASVVIMLPKADQKVNHKPVKCVALRKPSGVVTARFSVLVKRW